MKNNEKSHLLPLLPLRGVLVFPNMILHLDVGRDKSIGALEEAMVGDQRIFLVAQKDAKTDDPEPEAIYKTGTVAKIKQLLKMPNDVIRVLIEGENRAIIRDYVQEEPYFKVEIESVVEEETITTQEDQALMRSVLGLFEQYMDFTQSMSQEIRASLQEVEDPGVFADIIGSHLAIKVQTKQRILEATSYKNRLETLFEILSKEVEIQKIERKISSRVRRQIDKNQKEYYLREQLRAIQRELGQQDERTAEADEYREKIQALGVDEDLEERMLREVDRLEKMPPVAAELSVIRTYLDWLIDLPWNTTTDDEIDIPKAEEILNEDHYALTKVKERILEFLAVQKLSGQIKGPILCLTGPPGVGKTSLAKSVARAMGRKFVRASLGGIRDEAEIRGHRRTYVGALPGRIIQGIKQAGSKNPVFLLDEIDKLTSDFRGDPSSALLEVLDPEQNHSFSDHYIESPFDLSKVMFITTANAKHNIPRPLLDRMEVVEIPGYTEIEKLEIAKRHLIPQQVKEHGLSEDQLKFSSEGLVKIIRNYTREAGVRNLNREIANLCRKAAKGIVENKFTSIKIDKAQVREYLGAHKYKYGVIETKDLVGVAVGLAWTEVGGDILSIEVSIMEGKGKLTLTGKLGDVMQESARASYSFVRSRAAELGIDPKFYEKKDVHIHVPEGAIPKDGPSAGTAIACALTSALTGRPVDRTVAMTGEITLRGRVLAVGGIKEKVLAAHRAGIKTVIMPEENIKDLEEVPQNVKDELYFVFADTMEKVFSSALKINLNLPPLPEETDGQLNLYTS